MENQIQLYHDVSLFYLDKEQELISEVQRLRATNQELSEQIKALKTENIELKEKVGQYRNHAANLEAENQALNKVLKVEFGDLTPDEIRALIEKLWGLWWTVRQKRYQAMFREYGLY